jgi:futalosine hydrolase
VPIDLVVCCATELECDLIRPHLPVVCTGVGAVNAAYGLTRFLERNEVRRVVVCGIGGAYAGSGLAVGDVAWGSSECYGDLGADSAEGFLDMRALGFPLIAGAEPVYNVMPLQIGKGVTVPFVTVNTCTGDDTSAAALVERTGGCVESMEGAAFVHVSRLAGVDVGEVRGISNPVGNRNRSAWKVKDAAVAAQTALLAAWRDHALD